jgi:hypothetical protein
MPGYNRSDEEWDLLVDVGREILMEVAGDGQTTNYTQLNRKLVERTDCRAFDFERPDERAAMGHLLGLIVERDQLTDPDSRKLMLSALVLYVDGNDAGAGFYTLAKELGLLSAKASQQEKEMFWVDQVQRLHTLHKGRRR